MWFAEDMPKIKQELVNCIKSLNVDKLRQLLNELPEDNYNDLHLLQMVCQIKDTPESSKAIRDLLLMLVDYGIDPNSSVPAGVQPPLISAISNNNCTALRTLLQCSTDLLQLSQLQPGSLTPPMKAIIRQYQPGLWVAVQGGNINDVRRLINLWVRVDAIKYNKSLIELAEEVGNEQIVKLISGIYHTMVLVHHVLARDLRKTISLLEKPELRGKFKMNLRNMSDRGAPIVYYAIQNNHTEMVKLLLNSGSQLFTLMRDAEGIECPVLFSAFTQEVQPDMIDALVAPTLFSESILQQVIYKSQGILEVALSAQIPLESFKLLLQRSGPRILVQRNCENQTIWETASDAGLSEYCDIIDQVVYEWIGSEERARHVLALHGYERITQVFSNRQPQSDLVQDYLSALPEYQEWIEYLSESIYNGDIESFEGLSAYQGDRADLFSCDILWNARCKGDGLPLLHKAVLTSNVEMVKQIIDAMEPLESVDSLVDEYHRTSLHYAHGMKETKKIKAILSLLYSNGASEHCLDKFGKEPLDFKEYSGTVAMEAYLGKIKTREVIPESLANAIWNQKPRRPREYKIQNHKHPHAHNHDNHEMPRDGMTTSSHMSCHSDHSLQQKAHAHQSRRSSLSSEVIRHNITSQSKQWGNRTLERADTLPSTDDSSRSSCSIQ